MIAIVVGAGPAGTAAAISLAQRGHRCVIVERSEFPRHRPGETLHPGVQPLIAQLGCESAFLEAGFLRFPGIYVETGSKTAFNPFGSDESGPWLGFQAWRDEFDSLLLKRSSDVGVELLQPCRARRPILEADRVIGIETDRGSIYSQFVVDASGSRHWLARHLGLSIPEFSPKLYARYGYSEAPRVDPPLPRFIADKAGWTWHAQVRDDMYHWTRLMFRPEDSTEENSIERRPEKRRGADVTWRCVRKSAGPGYFILGDAAAVLDPASSHGVLRALMSGIMAADVAQKISAGPDNELKLTSGYCDWWNDWFTHDVTHLKKWYREAGLLGGWTSFMAKA